MYPRELVCRVLYTVLQSSELVCQNEGELTGHYSTRQPRIKNRKNQWGYTSQVLPTAVEIRFRWKIDCVPLCYVREACHLKPTQDYRSCIHTSNTPKIWTKGKKPVVIVGYLQEVRYVTNLLAANIKFCYLSLSAAFDDVNRSHWRLKVTNIFWIVTHRLLFGVSRQLSAQLRVHTKYVLMSSNVSHRESSA